MGWRAAPDAAFTKERLFFPTMDIKQAGFLFVYLSYDNASNNFVYFDDLKINHQQTNVVQYNEYYALVYLHQQVGREKIQRTISYIMQDLS
jgi:hypothetical protein